MCALVSIIRLFPLSHWTQDEEKPPLPYGTEGYIPCKTERRLAAKFFYMKCSLNPSWYVIYRIGKYSSQSQLHRKFKIKQQTIPYNQHNND
jgi:hypothetical protein